MSTSSLRIPIPQVVRALPLLQDGYATDTRVRYEDAIGMYAEGDTERVVAVCGTDSLNDVIEDLRAKLVTATLTEVMAGSGAKVHAGFLRAYKESCDNIINACLPVPHVTLVGHSLGAALACMAAYNLVTRYERDAWRVQVVTLGSPRIGNRKWANMYNEAVPKTWRIATLADPIVCLPPPWGWCHVGENIRLREDGSRAGNSWAIMLHLLYALRCRTEVHGHQLADYAQVVHAAATRGAL